MIEKFSYDISKKELYINENIIKADNIDEGVSKLHNYYNKLKLKEERKKKITILNNVAEHSN